MKIVSMEDVDTIHVDPVSFYLEHYIPTEGIVLLYGRFGSFKTPITLAMAKALATGTELWGLSVTQANPVLYVEGDMPESPALTRIQQLKFKGGEGDIAFVYPGFDVVNPNSSQSSADTYTALQLAHQKKQYKAVFIDSLRCIHNLPDEMSSTVNRVYHGLARLFPKAVIILVHHDRKTKPELLALSPEAQDSLNVESFAGSQAWANHAVVGLRVKVTNRFTKEVTIQHTKSQAGEEQPNIRLKIADGIHCNALGANPVEVSKFLSSIKTPHTTRELDKMIAEHFGVSERTARTKRLLTVAPLGNEKAVE